MTDKNLEPIHFQTSLSAISGFMLYNIRDQMGVNQREISKIFDMTHVTYGSMERGETAINSDFIYMLCSLVGIKFSDYFVLIDEIVNHLTNINTCQLNSNILVRIIPSSDILKYMNATNGKVSEGYAIGADMINLIIGQNFNFFLSNEIKSKIALLSQFRLTDAQIKELININTEELENKLHFMDDRSLAEGSSVAASLASLSIASALGLNVTSTTVGLIGVGGYELYKAYKKNKEDKKK
jgi:transcriptional regulator with XRE-family HTH domain